MLDEGGVTHEVNPALALARHAFFAALDADVLDAVVRRAVLRLYEKGAYVYVEGETALGSTSSCLAPYVSSGRPRMGASRTCFTRRHCPDNRTDDARAHQ